MSSTATTRNLRFGIVGSIVIAGAVGTWLTRGEAAPPLARPMAAATAQPQVGRQVTYALHLRSQVGATTQQLDARCNVRVRSVQGDACDLVFTLADVRWQVDGTRMPTQETALRAPCAAQFATGRLRSFACAPELPDSVQHQLRGLWQMFQWCTPSSPDTDIEDSFGRCAVRMNVSADGALLQQKLRYAAAAPTAGGDLPCTARVLGSHARFVPAADGVWLQDAEVHEQLELASDQATLLTLAQDATLHRTADAEDAAKTATAALDVSPEVLAAARSLATEQAMPAERAATAADREAFAKRLEAFVAGGGTDITALHALADMLAAMPELAMLVDEALRRPDLPDRAQASLMHALELGGGDACQTVLIDRALMASGEPMLRLRAVAALGGLRRPSLDAEKSLQEVVRSDAGTLGHSALLALGAMQKQLQTNDPARAANLREELATRLASAPTAEDQLLALRAIANTGDPAQHDPVSHLLVDGEPRLRAGAAQALAAVSGGDALLPLCEQLRREPDAAVRTAIGSALGTSGNASDATSRACAAQLDNEPDRGARASLARYLSDHLDSAPEVRPALHRYLQSDLDDRTRSYVAGRLLRRAP